MVSPRRWDWLPNSLTVSRFILGAALPFLPAEWQFGVLLAAGFTDLIDGWIGRILGCTSGFGQVMDPIADKTLVLGAVGTALVAGWVTPLELVLIAARDLTVLVLSARALSLGVANWRKLTPRLSGKFATGAQVAALLLLFWTRQPCPVMVGIAAAFSVLSAVDYSWRAWTAAGTR
jgi:phosphatidylglycerophosphate synthase